jgi:SNF2 family DNA or RNA helicase
MHKNSSLHFNCFNKKSEQNLKNIQKNLKNIPKVERLVNVSKEEKEEAVYLKEVLFSTLKPHQVEGIRYMWDHIVTPKKDSLKGCILAHSMVGFHFLIFLKGFRKDFTNCFLY